MLWASTLEMGGWDRAVLGDGDSWTDLGSLGLGVRITGWTWHGEDVLGSRQYGLRYR